MIHIKSFNTFLNESQVPSFNVDIESLLSILGEKIDLFKTFKIDKDQIAKAFEHFLATGNLNSKTNLGLRQVCSHFT